MPDVLTERGKPYISLLHQIKQEPVSHQNEHIYGVVVCLSFEQDAVSILQGQATGNLPSLKFSRQKTFAHLPLPVFFNHL